MAPVAVEATAENKPTAHAVDLFPWLMCEVTSELPVGKFTVGNLLRLQKGSIVATGSPTTGDIPLRVNKLLLGWTQFEVVEDKLAVRITELE